MSADNIQAPESRTYVLGEINEESANALIAFILHVNEYDDLQEEKTNGYLRKPIRLIVNSSGGTNYDGMAIIGAIETSKTEVHSVGFGCVMSSALDVFVACHHRSAHRMTTFMYHSLRSISEGEVEKQVTDVNESLRIQSEGDKFLMSKTKLPKKRLDEIRKKKDDWYFTSQEALKYGVIDEVL